MNAVNPKQITLAREARNLTQGELCKLIPSLNQGNLSKLERGQLSASPSTIETIATALNFPVPFFYEEDVRPPLSNLYYRKQYKVTGNVLKTLRARISIITRAIGHMMDGVDMDMKFKRLLFDVSDGSYTPQSAALGAREILGIPNGEPIHNLVSYIEKSGIMIYYTNFDIDGFDGMAAFTDSGWPILFINGCKTNDRLRMNIAHELAHVVLHIPFIVDEFREPEYEAKQYAGEFLMPSHAIRKELRYITYDRLTPLKEYWRVSKAALIQKAYSLGAISKESYIYLRTQLSRKGELKNETGFVDLDKPTLLQKIINLYRESMGYGDGDLAELTNLSIEDFNSYFKDSDGGEVRLKRLVPSI